MDFCGRQAVRTREKSKRLYSFSKMWKSGDKVVVYYPLQWNDEAQAVDIMVAACWGHSINPKESGIKRVFIPSNAVLNNGIPEVPDALYRASKLAKLFKDGKKEQGLAGLAKKKNISDAMKTDALAEIEKDYKNSDPIVGRLTYNICTECTVVPLGPDGVPNVKEAKVCSQDTSDKKLKSLFAIIDDAQFCVTRDSKFLEVTYTFGATGDRKDDGKVEPKGVTPAFSLKEKFPVDTYPTIWPTIEGLLSSMPESSEIIYGRNSNFIKMEESEFVAKLSMYSLMHSEFLDALDTEEELNALKRNASLLQSMRVELSDGTKAATAVAEQLAVEAEEAATAAAEEAAKAPTMQELIPQTEVDEAKNNPDEDVDDLASKALDNGFGFGGSLGDLTE